MLCANTCVTTVRHQVARNTMMHAELRWVPDLVWIIARRNRVIMSFGPHHGVFI